MARTKVAKTAEQNVENKASVVNTINTKVVGIRVYSNGDSIRYRVQFEDAFTAIVKQGEEYVEAEVDYIDFIPRVLIAQCLSIVEGLDLLYTKKKEQGLRNDNETGFGAAELQVILRKATIILERTKFLAGEEYTDSDDETQTHEHDGYNTVITEITVTDKIQQKLDALIDKMFDI